MSPGEIRPSAAQLQSVESETGPKTISSPVFRYSFAASAPKGLSSSRFDGMLADPVCFLG
jgi:hypothetical protein